MSRIPDPGRPVKLPYFPLFVADFVEGTSGMSSSELAVYLLVLLHEWGHGRFPEDHGRLARIARVGAEEFAAAWPAVRKKFRQDAEGLLYNAVLEEHQAKALGICERRSVAGRLGATARWGEDGKRNAIANGKRNGKRMASQSQSQSPTLAVAGVLFGPEAPVAARSRRGGSKTGPEQKAVQAHFEMRYLAAYGEPYPFDGGKDGALLKCLVEKRAKGDVQECCNRIDRIFAEEWCVRAGIDLGTICSRWAKHPADKGRAIKATNVREPTQIDLDRLREGMASDIKGVPEQAQHHFTKTTGRDWRDYAQEIRRNGKHE